MSKESRKLKPEEEARVIIDEQLREAGWDIVDRNDIVPGGYPYAVREELMKDNTESDYYLYVEDKAIALVEAKRKEVKLGKAVADQAEGYARSPRDIIPTWFKDSAVKVPLVFLANSKEIRYKNLLEDGDKEYEVIQKIPTPKKMLQLAGVESNYGALPALSKNGLRDCQYDAEINLEKSIRAGRRKSLAHLTMGAGKTYLACLATYRLLAYTKVSRVLFLADRTNLVEQAETALNKFELTETGMAMGSIYGIAKLKKPEDINQQIVVSTIQKLFSVMTGQAVMDDDHDEDVLERDSAEDNEPKVDLGNNIRIGKDHFDFIIVDECHRSIYDKWRPVLDYFSNAIILGLTATPTPETLAYFNENVIERYTDKQAEVDGVNVPKRIYRIITRTTAAGGEIKTGETVTETSNKTHEDKEVSFTNDARYAPNELDYVVTDLSQIRTVLTAYRDAIYTDLFPDREPVWAYIPKTLIFAKTDSHATHIVEQVRNVFAEKFGGKVPDKFVQKITYTANDPTGLIKEFNSSREFRIAVTVTLVSTGTDVKALDVVFFMADVKSEVLYNQMIGRGCRTINDDEYNEVTPGKYPKQYYYVVDAVGVTSKDKAVRLWVGPNGANRHKPDLEHLLELLAHMNLQDENLAMLADYCASINNRYYTNDKFKRHLMEYMDKYGFGPAEIAQNINEALEMQTLPPFVSNTEDNAERLALISDLITNVSARRQLVELQKGYFLTTDNNEDELIMSGFTGTEAKSFVETFEAYINAHKDEIEALRIIYNSEDKLITRKMLQELSTALISANKLYTPACIWSNYKAQDTKGVVDELDMKGKVNALTKLIQIVRFAFRKSPALVNLSSLRNSRFNLYLGQKQRTLTEDQISVMTQIADYIINEGAITANELNKIDTDLWRKAFIAYNSPKTLDDEMATLSRFILKAA